VIDKIDQYIGNLIHLGIQPREIEAMPFHKMKYYNGWHKIFKRAWESD